MNISQIIKSIIVLLLIAQNSTAQKFILPNEEVVIYFKTIHGKTMVLAKDTANNYLIYRYGKDKIEFEFPEKDTSSWSKFHYSNYLRGVGANNEGLDLNYVYFTNNDFKYVIYDNYYAVTDKDYNGILIFDLKTEQKTEIKAVVKTKKGTLISLRDNEFINTGEEIFD